MKNKTMDQLIRELEKLRRKNAKLERMKTDYSRIKEELVRSKRENAIIKKIAAVFFTAPDGKMYGEALAVILEIMESKIGFFGYIQENGDLVIPDTGRDVSDTFFFRSKTTVLPPSVWGEYFWGKALRESRSIISEGPFHTPEGLIHIDNSLAVPIVHGKEVIGLLVVANKKQGYAEGDGNLLEGIAGGISPVLKAQLQRDSHERMRRKAEEELKFTNLLLSTQQEISIDGILVFGPEDKIISFNKRFIDMWGIPPEVIESRSFERAIKYILDKLAEPARFLERTRYSYECSRDTSRDEIGLVDGRILEHYSAPMERVDGKNYGRVWFFHDITQSRRAEEKIIHSEEMFRALFMSMGEGFYLSEVIYDDKGNPCDYRYLEVNPKFEQIIGLPRDQIIGKRYSEIVPTDTTQWLDNYFKVALTGESRTYEFYSAEYRMHFETYSYRPAKGQVSVLVLNITERKKLEDQLRQAQKMEAIGMLAGGIAHDFNNILMALTGFTTLLQLNMNPDDPLHEFVDQIMSASQKAVDLTKSLLAFSRQQPVIFRPLGLNDIVKEAEKLLKRLVTEDVIIKTALSPDQPVVMADAAQMDQVLLNLASNANDAMPKGGTLVIETKCLELDDEFRRLHGFGKQGKYALLCVSDNGIGMDEAVKKKIFDPFFTTKEVGKGTGLGLSTVYGIVKQHNGYITVYSEPGVGTTFSMYFPMASETVEKEKAAAAPATGGKEVILIAEDNASVRGLMTRVLSRYGYTIIEAIDGVDAIEQFNKSSKVDLLILDSIMPRKNGRETYNEIHNAEPDIRVLFTSGYTRDIILDKGIEDKKFHFISKPVRPVDLLNKVREILDQ